MTLSTEDQARLISGLRDDIEQGLLSPCLKPLLLNTGDGTFSCSGNSFAGNPLPEFCCISWNILDCFAVAVLSAPSLQFIEKAVLLRCRLGEEQGTLFLHLVAMTFESESVSPLEMTEECEVLVAGSLRVLARAKEMTLGSIYWVRSKGHSIFSLPYPGQMVRSRVSGLGESGEDGKERWPECEVVLGVVEDSLRHRAGQLATLVSANADGSVQ